MKFEINQSFPLDLLSYEEKQISCADEIIDGMKHLIHKSISKIGIDLSGESCIIGPTVVRFEFMPAVKIIPSCISSLRNNLNKALLEYGPIRLVTSDEEKGTIVIEVARPDRQSVSLRSILESKEFMESKAKLPVALGLSSENKPIVKDLFWMVDLLIVGMTGMGKSVLLHNIITSLIYAKRPEQLKFILIDSHRNEFSRYSNLQFSYLATFDDKPAIITKSNDVLRVLDALILEAEKRDIIQSKAEVSFRNNDLQQPSIVVIIDEIADLFTCCGYELIHSLYRIAAYGKSTGIHFVCTSQRPTSESLSDVLNDRFIDMFQAHISFKVNTEDESKRIIESPDARSLCDRGDAILYWEEYDRFVEGTYKHIERIQVCDIDTYEITDILKFLELPQTVPYVFPTKVVTIPMDNQWESIIQDISDPLFEEVAQFVVISNCANTSQIQRRFAIGYNRARRLVSQLEAAGIVSPDKGRKPREVLKNLEELLALTNNDSSKQLGRKESKRGWFVGFKFRIMSIFQQ